jgi:hypothetical protein
VQAHKARAKSKTATGQRKKMAIKRARVMPLTANWPSKLDSRIRSMIGAALQIGQTRSVPKGAKTARGLGRAVARPREIERDPARRGGGSNIFVSASTGSSHTQQSKNDVTGHKRAFGPWAGSLQIQFNAAVYPGARPRSETAYLEEISARCIAAGTPVCSRDAGYAGRRNSGRTFRQC